MTFFLNNSSKYEYFWIANWHEQPGLPGLIRANLLPKDADLSRRPH